MTISRRSIVLLIAAAVIMVAAAVGITLAISEDSVSPKTVFTVSGTMDLGQCAGKGINYASDLKVGGQVEVTAQNGDVLGAGSLTPYTNPDEPNSCKRTFVIPNVPTGQALYGVRIGSAARGVIWKNEADAKAGLELTIN